MANAFDQFDGAPTAFGAPVAPPVPDQPADQSSNPFDAFDGQSTAFGNSSAAIGGGDKTSGGDEPATLTSVAKNFGAGMLAGIPNLATTVQHALTPPDLISGAKHWWDVVSDPDAWKLSGPASPELQAKIDAGRAEREAQLGPGVGELMKRGMGELGFDPDNPEQMPQPQNAPERVARMGGEGASSMLVPGLGVGSIPARLAVGAGSGIGAGAGQELAPEGYKGLGGFLGGLVGGGIGSIASEVPAATKAAVRSGADYAAPMVAPYSTAVRQKIAGKTLVNAAEDPDAVVSTLSNAPKDIVPGSAPTTFQATGDSGLGQLERAVATKSPEDFLQRRADQNSARLKALTDIQADGHPEAVGSFFRDQLDDIDQRMQAIQDQASTSARSATEGLGGGQAPDVLGETARASLQNSLDAAKTSEGALWKAVDPDGTMQVAATPLKTAYADVYGKLGPEASIGMTPVEKQIGEVIQGYGDALPLQRMVGLRSVVSKAMRDSNSPLQPNSIAYGRLSQLRGAVEDAISQSVTQKAAAEQQAVQMGAMQPEDMMLERLRQEVNDFQSAKRAQLLGTAGGDTGGAISRGARVLPRQVGAGDEAGRPPVGPAGGAQPQGTFLDQDAADRLKTATAATAQRKQTFSQAPVAKILQRQGTTQPYAMPGGAVSAAAWKAGAGGGDAINAIVKASPEAIGPLKEIAAASLRAKAQDGILTSRALDAWRTQHAPALKALEAASPGFTAAFETAAKAGDHFAMLAQQRKDALASVERSAVGKLLKLDDPADVVKTVGSVFNRSDAVKTMRGLAQAASRDPAALQGLRRAVVEYMEQKLVSNTEAGTSGQNLIKSDAFQTFLGKNNTALRQVFSDDELGTMRAIAQDLKRANRSIASSKLPGQSNTAQDLKAMANYDLKPTLLSKLFTHVVGGGAGFALDGGITGTLAGLIGSHVVSGLREAGIRSVDDLLKEAMLNPELAKALMMKAPKRPDTGSAITLANKLRSVGVFSAVQNNGQR